MVVNTLDVCLFEKMVFACIVFVKDVLKCLPARLLYKIYPSKIKALLLLYA